MRSVLLFVVAYLATASASRLFSDDLNTLAARQLLQTTTGSVYAACPSNCDVDNNKCTFDSSAAGYKCIQCLNNLVVVKGRCGCPAGRYLDGPNQRCVDCPLNSWCPGGTYDQAQPNPADNLNQPIKTDCTFGLITRAKRSKTRTMCVNPPGTYFTTTDSGCTAQAPCAKTCPVDSFTPGLNKQRRCTPCPTGFKTNTATGATSSQACMVPPGFYLKTPGQVAPCPKGEYQPNWVAPNTGVGKCTSCGVGITTNVANAATARTACVFTQAGYAPLSADTSVTAVTWLTAAVKCPQNFYCPGGEVTAVMDTDNPSAAQQLFPCTVNSVSGLWTQDVGATSVDECMIPPGFGKASSGDSTITQCATGATGQYRDGWLPGDQVTTAAVVCKTCGTNIKGVLNDQVTTYTWNSGSSDYDVGSINVASSSGNCYIEAGMGMYYIAGSGGASSYRATTCTGASAQYGVATQTYGLAANPCKPCSTGLVITSTSATDYTDLTSGGITSAAACVTQAGWGWDGRVSTPCPKGSWAIGGTLSPCTECGYGLTTANTAATALSACLLAQGYGSVSGVIQQCPLGYYNDLDGVNPITTACSACTLGKTTTEVGAVDAATDCDACPSGTGALTAGATSFTDVGCSPCESGYYGPTRQSVDIQTDQTCVACPTSTTGFQFFYNGDEYPYQSLAVSKTAATTSGECLSQFAQITDGLWYFDTGAAIGGTPNAGDADIGTCLAQCTGTCQFATYDYAASSGKCTLYSTADVGDGAGILAYKAVPSGDIYAAAQSVKAKSATPSGLYTQWPVDSGLTDLPGQSTTDSTSTTKETCFNDCDADTECAAVFFTGTTCKLLKGVATPGAANAAKRSLTRAVPDQAY